MLTMKHDNPIRALFVGEDPIKSSPLLTLAKAVKPHGIHPRFSGQTEFASTREWVALARDSAVILFVGYHGPAPYMIRTARVSGKHWNAGRSMVGRFRCTLLHQRSNQDAMGENTPEILCGGYHRGSASANRTGIGRIEVENYPNCSES